MDPHGLVLYSAVMMAVSMGMTAWRLAASPGKVTGQVDGMLGFCLLGSALLFVTALIPGTQLF